MQSIFTGFSSLPAFLALLTLASCTTSAKEVSYSCPASIGVAATVVNAAGKWETIDRGQTNSHTLVAAGFTDGHPKELADLKPWHIDDGSPSAGKPRTVIYKFEGKYPDGIWLSCSYRDTSLVAFQRLPETPSSCEVIYSQKPGMAPTVDSVHCK